MSQNKQRLSWLEMLKVNQRAYLLFYKRYPRMILSRFALIIWKALTPYVGIYFSALIIEELAGAKNPGRIRFLVLLTLFLIAAGSLVTALLEKWKNVQSAGMWLKIKKILSEKLFETDYVNLDETKNIELYSAICQNHNSAGWGLYRTLEDCEALCQTVIVILGGASLTLSLFTSQVLESAGKYTILNNPLFVILIALIMLAVTCISPVLAGKAGRYLTSLADIHNLGNRMFSYYGHLGYDTKKAADMRIYRQDKICEKYNLNKESTFGSRGVFARYQKGPVGFYLAGASAVSGIFTGIAYVFVCLKARAGAFGLGAVTRYVASITRVYGGISTLITTMEDMRSNAAFLNMVFEFLDIPDHMYQGSLTVEKRNDRKYEVEFRNVSFQYPGSQEYALKDVNIKFEIGKKLAVVGMNGSGKTTFIKLLCRLYDPTEGEILLNGIDIRKYNYREYMTIFSVVFQDFKLFSLPLGENVAARTNYDRELVTEALEKAGFKERLAKMPHGLSTCLYKEYTESGVSISGGEAQKIAIARALYKNAPFIILDEPTASLDPVAEAEIYEKFAEIVGDRTAIYISHRLSSCKFCDKIAVFHHGTIVQTGTHQSLLTDQTGIYHTLWQAQAQYYT
ncbi:aBC transporter related [Ruminococcus sp. CAG:60]|nr:aBC transporter related [Ruminococcus sp. CAG:60]